PAKICTSLAFVTCCPNAVISCREPAPLYATAATAAATDNTISTIPTIMAVHLHWPVRADDSGYPTRVESNLAESNVSAERSHRVSAVAASVRACSDSPYALNHTKPVSVTETSRGQFIPPWDNGAFSCSTVQWVPGCYACATVSPRAIQ